MLAKEYGIKPWEFEEEVSAYWYRRMEAFHNVMYEAPKKK